MPSNRLNRSPPDNLVKVWPFIDWLDRTHCRTAPIDSPVYERLNAEQRLLVHWLCYILDLQTDYRRVWAVGGPIISELVEAYSTRRDDPLAILREFSSPTAEGKVPPLNAQRQSRANEPNKLSFNARFLDWFSIALTLVILDRFGRSIGGYLHRHKNFLLACDDGELPKRIAFLFGLLTYVDVGKQERSLYGNSFALKVADHSGKKQNLLKSPDRLEERFRKWIGKHFHKRLWAAVRDYLKKDGSEFYKYFLSVLREHGLKVLAERIDRSSDAVLVGLEVPGDVWNEDFFKRIFGKQNKLKPKQLRKWFDDLRKSGDLPVNAAVERLDISFHYSPSMCAKEREGSCIFRAESNIWAYCPPRGGVRWELNPCPVTAYLCGFHYACEPTGCPIRQAVPTNLCPGCRSKIREQAVSPLPS